jgi:hypothetical protein
VYAANAARIQHFAEREPELSPIRRGRRRVGESRAQPRDQRIIRPCDFLQAGVARQCAVASRLQCEDLLVERAGVRLLAEVLPEVRQIQQRWNIVGIERQCGLQLALRSVVLA